MEDDATQEAVELTAMIFFICFSFALLWLLLEYLLDWVQSKSQEFFFLSKILMENSVLPKFDRLISWYGKKLEICKQACPFRIVYHNKLEELSANLKFLAHQLLIIPKQ